MDSFNFKKFTSDAGTLFNRAVQYTGEKLGGAEKTELDAHFENLLQRADSTRQWTERILAQTETLLQPNPNVRMESFLYEKLEKAKRDRQTNFEVLGQCMIDSGNDFGPGTSYGNALVKCGQTEQKMGMAEKEFHAAATNNFLIPLKTFLEGDMKTLQKERKVLEGKRLDLDAAKGRLRKAKAQAAQQAAEAELRVAQSEFDRQGEITKLLLEGISSTHAHHLRCLNDFIEAQMTYFAQCQQYMQDLQRQLGSYNVGGSSSSLSGGVGGGSGGNNIPSATSPNIRPPLYSNLSSSNPGGATVSPSAPPANAESAPSTSPSSGTRRARVLYDYDAGDMKELSLQADEIIDVYNLPGLDSDWMIGERAKGGSIQRGKVPVTYLELID